MFGNHENPVIDGNKECTKCHQMLPLGLFNKAKQNPSGRRAACKKCQYKADKDRVARRKAGDAVDARARYVFGPDGLKACSVCGERKPVDCFSPAPIMASGYESRCKQCNNARQAAAVNDSISQFLKSLNHGSALGCKRAGKNSKRRGFEHSISHEDLITLWKQQGGVCALTGIAMTHTRGRGRVMTNASIDRINSDLGYIPGNVRLVSLAANIIRGELSDEELLDWCRAIVAKHEST